MQVNNNNETRVPVVYANVNKAEIPLTSLATYKVFEEMGEKASVVTPELVKNVTDLNAACADLAQAKKRFICNRILGCLMIAVTIALFVLGPLIGAGMFGGAESWVLPLGLSMGISATPSTILTAFLLSSEHPENQIENLKYHLQWRYLHSLPTMVNFYRNNQEKIASGIEKQLSDSRQSLEVIKNVPVKTLAGEKELEGRVKTLETAQQEFFAARDFYAKFNAIVPAAA